VGSPAPLKSADLVSTGYRNQLLFQNNNQGFKMGYRVDTQKVASIVVEVNRMLTSKNISHGEVVLALAELLGRVIVEAAQNKIQAQELVKVSLEHLDATITRGAAYRDKRIITGE
jgi:hypothetical protein